MKRNSRLIVAALTAAFSLSQAVAQDFKPYPASKADPEASSAASSNRVRCQVYTTTDSFDRLYFFYKGLYTEARWPVPAPKLPDDKEIRWAYFILDGARDLAHSRYWMKIQRPYILTVDEDLDFKGIRDVSMIQTIRRN